MRTRSLFTTVAATMVLAGAGAGTAFASNTSTQPSPVPSTPAVTSAPSAVPTTMAAPPRPSASAVPSTPPAPVPSRGGGNQVGAVPSGAPNTGVPSDTSNGYGEAAAVGAGLVLLAGGSGGVALRRRLKGRG